MKRSIEEIAADLVTRRTKPTLESPSLRLTGIDPITGIGFSFEEGGFFIWIGNKTRIDVRNPDGTATLEAERDHIVPRVAEWIANNT